MKRSSFVCLLVLVAATRPPSAGADDPAWGAEKKNHWAWKAPLRPVVPPVRAGGWVRNPIDAFVLAKLEAAGLRPADPASRAHLIRRVTFDLIGLPPTPAEVDAFVADRAPNAWDKVIDRLLASPHYGERWGRHWLDLARFAESNGYEFDEPRPSAWRYRDYVIASFNADKPYDRFITEQLAGDEVAPDDPAALIATGFNLLGPDMTDASSQAQRRQNTLDDMTDTASLVFLGLTAGCARCHNHKFEPIAQTDYFRLQAFFTPAEFRKDLLAADAAQRADYEKKMQAYQHLTAPIRTQLEALEAPYRKRLYAMRLANLSDADRLAHQTPEAQRTPMQIEQVANSIRRLAVPAKDVSAAMTRQDRARQDQLLQELKKLDSQKPSLPTTMGMQETGKAPKTFVLRRGELRNPGAEVQPGWPVILTRGFRAEPAPIKAPAARVSGRRSALAAWIASPANPLTGRVMVNRIWQHHFGRGIVATPSDFGLRGLAPTHPELLDWLACEFMSAAEGEPRAWSIKRMHRLMLRSATYQQATLAPAQTLRNDPANSLFGRMTRLRLEGEIIRDSLLAVSGRLNGTMGGPSVFPPLPPEAGTGGKEWKVSPDVADHVRRSVYIFARRNLRFPFLEPFDIPDSNQSCPQRERSTTAPQALALLNASDVTAAAKALAARLEKEAAADERVARAYQLTLGRAPTPTESEAAREFVADAPLSELCRALFNVNEFVYLD